MSTLKETCSIRRSVIAGMMFITAERDEYLKGNVFNMAERGEDEVQ